MKTPTILLASALLVVMVPGCGDKATVTNSLTQATTGTASTERGSNRSVGRTAAGLYETDDGDHDGDDGPKPTAASQDDRRLIARYRKADKAETHAIVDLVTRYYEASITGNGSRACSLLAGELVASMAADSRESGQTAREVCPPALSRLLAQQHQHLANENPATMAVIGVYTKHNLGLVLLGFKASLESDILIAREGRTWKIDALFDSALT